MSTLILPLYFTNSQFGSSQVDGQIKAYIEHIDANNIGGAENCLIWLLSYQVENGFYNKPTKKFAEMLPASLNILSEKLNLIEIDITNKQKEIGLQNDELDAAKKELQNLIIQKREELTQITVNLSTSNAQSIQISELLTRGSEQSSRLTAILEQQEQNKAASEIKLQQLQVLYQSTADKLTENLKIIQLQIEDFKKQIETNEGHLNFIEGKREFFDERNKYLEDLIGREVGASLFETFKQRKLELELPVKFWRWAVPTMSIATVLWIFFLFSNHIESNEVSIWWQTFAVNTLKSIPAIFLLLFSINQYRKERNFQEEYAFKSSVALTIKAYADQLESVENKDLLIMKSVLSVYQTPIEDKHSEKINSSSALETIKTMIDTTSDLVKKTK